jgi:hypothetical protein
MTAKSMTPYLCLVIELPSLDVAWEGPLDDVELDVVLAVLPEPVAVLSVVFADALVLFDDAEVWTRIPPDVVFVAEAEVELPEVESELELPPHVPLDLMLV